MDHLELKASIAIDSAGTLSGIAWPFNAGPDQLGDVITKGAFNIAVDDLPILLCHDPEQPIGLWSEVAETADGLTVKGQLFQDDRRARAVRSMIRSGLITGLSIGFKTKASTPRPNKGRVISSLDLHEVSVVRNPAHPRARILHAKTATAAIAIAAAINRAAAALRSQ
jgi:HK97 family phage prohead protease